MKNIFRISSVILIIFFLNHSCKKDKSESDSEKKIIDKYIIEMNTGYRISRVTHLDSNNGLMYDRLYNYSDSEILVTDFNSGNLISTYFLNKNGLADSCIEGSNRIKYKYDNNKYLILFSYYPYHDLNSLLYENGNRTHVENFPLHGISYEYTSLSNLIDIESFQGFYLGNLNKNLISKIRYQNGPHGNEATNTVYDYILNPEGLVINRTGVSTNELYLSLPDMAPQNPTEKLITNFEYIIKN